jgi:hypothetical protein
LRADGRRAGGGTESTCFIVQRLNCLCLLRLQSAAPIGEITANSPARPNITGCLIFSPAQPIVRPSYVSRFHTAAAPSRARTVRIHHAIMQPLGVCVVEPQPNRRFRMGRHGGIASRLGLPGTTVVRRKDRAGEAFELNTCGAVDGEGNINNNEYLVSGAPRSGALPPPTARCSRFTAAAVYGRHRQP